VRGGLLAVGIRDRASERVDAVPGGLSSHTVSDMISEIGRRFAIAAAAITAYDVRGALLETQAGGTCIAASAALAAIVASSLSRAISSTIAVV
jgi:hypothetical protein